MKRRQKPLIDCFEVRANPFFRERGLQRRLGHTPQTWRGLTCKHYACMRKRNSQTKFRDEEKKEAQVPTENVKKPNGKNLHSRIQQICNLRWEDPFGCNQRKMPKKGRGKENTQGRWLSSDWCQNIIWFWSSWTVSWSISRDSELCWRNPLKILWSYGEHSPDEFKNGAPALRLLKGLYALKQAPKTLERYSR